MSTCREPTLLQEVVEELPLTPGRAIPEEVAEEEADFHGGGTTFEQESDYLGLYFYLRRDMKVPGGDAPPSEPWTPNEHLHGFLLV